MQSNSKSEYISCSHDEAKYVVSGCNFFYKYIEIEPIFCSCRELCEMYFLSK